MKSSEGIRYGLLTVGGCLILGLLYARSTSIDVDVHHDYDRSLQMLETLDARLGENVLRLRFGLVGHYDGLVDNVDELDRVRVRLLETPAFLEFADREALSGAVGQYAAAADAKAELVEQFKSTNAALQGSLRYFPVVSRQLIENAPPPLDAKSSELLQAVLEYEVSGADRDRETALAAFEALAPGAGTTAEELEPLLDTTLAHARNVLDRRTRLDVLIARIEAGTTRRLIDGLQSRYEQAYATANQKAEVGRWLLFLMGAITLAWTVHALRALERARTRLERANATLDQRVSERTAELSVAKALLERDSERLRDLNAELEDSNRELDDFAYIASHDLKEPLRGINNYAAFLIEDYGEKLDEDGRKKLETLKRLAQRMDSLIETLLHFSRVGRTELATGVTCLQEVVEEVVDSLHISLEQRGVEIRIPAPLPSVYCDRVRVTEVFRNLVSNALKYNDKPEPWIEIGFERATGEADPDKAQTTFYVRDNGIGIREKHQDSVFRLFKRLHGRDKFGGGTGAGLTIVKKIVEHHGGRVWLESEAGQGTTFHFDLGERETVVE